MMFSSLYHSSFWAQFHFWNRPSFGHHVISQGNQTKTNSASFSNPTITKNRIGTVNLQRWECLAPAHVEWPHIWVSSSNSHTTPLTRDSSNRQGSQICVQHTLMDKSKAIWGGDQKGRRKGRKRKRTTEDDQWWCTRYMPQKTLWCMVWDPKVAIQIRVKETKVVNWIQWLLQVVAWWATRLVGWMTPGGGWRREKDYHLLLDKRICTTKRTLDAEVAILTRLTNDEPECGSCDAWPKQDA